MDSVEYTNLEDKDVWTVGDVPEVKVELSASEGYRFSYTSKSHFKISGCDAEFKKAKIYDDGDYMEVTVELDRIGGKLEAVDNLDWNDSTAEWDEVEGDVYKRQELHGYGRLQKKQIVNKIRRGPILPQSEKAPRRK